MSSIVERYDRDAARYGHHWAPVLEQTARGLLDRIDREVRLPPHPVILDVGTGHGVLALDALARWPDATVIAADASSGMLAEARRVARRQPDRASRLRWLHAPAEDLGLPGASVDLLVSSFVYQLVPDRSTALAEAFRVIRPGGRLALVSWLDRDDGFRPAIEFDEAVGDLDILEPEHPDGDRELRAGDFRSPRAAASELRAAGFDRVGAREVRLEHAWTLDGYLEFKRRYEEDALFGRLEAATAGRLLGRARERLEALPPGAFTWRTVVVSVIARRPGRAGLEVTRRPAAARPGPAGDTPIDRSCPLRAHAANGDARRGRQSRQAR